MSQNDKRQLREFYERQASTLSDHQEEMYCGDDVFAIGRMRQILSYMQGVKIRSLLDVGCAEGLYLKWFEEHSPQGLAVGLDLSLRYLLKARERACGRYHVQADSGLLPFRDSCFDMVLCSEVLEHTPDPKEVFKELVRVSRGHLIVTTPGHGLIYYMVMRIGPLYRWLIRRGHICGQDPFQSAGLGAGHISEVQVRDLAGWAEELGCRIEIVNQEMITCRGEARRIIDWCNLAREAADKYSV